ncbi:hypothetical protein [Tabrizicola soli]|uniref:Uncharacterized protein n=1 Tax=Tabrizicola soli TaxID=2185115 RepID=A0ABV7DTW0_9RHOB|nr:hypothetical protein [Tabrizicola soli]
MSLTHDQLPPTDRPEKFWSGRIESLSAQIRDCRDRVASSEDELHVLPGISLSNWLKMLRVDLLEAVVEREAARAKREAELPAGGADDGVETEGLDATLTRLRDLLPDLENPTVPEFAQMTPEDEAAWETEHRGGSGPWDTLSANERRKLQ